MGIPQYTAQNITYTVHTQNAKHRPFGDPNLVWSGLTRNNITNNNDIWWRGRRDDIFAQSATTEGESSEHLLLKDIYNIMTMAMMMILLHKSCKVFYLLMIMIFIDIIPNIFSCATKINFARLSLLCWLDSWPMHHEAAQLSQFQLLCWLQLLHCSGVERQMQPRVKISGGI